MFKNFNLIIFCLILFLGSCSKQSAPVIEGTEVRSNEEQQRLDACSKVNFNQDVLEYQNVNLLFRCTSWDRDFPSLFNSIRNIRAESWNHVFTPINDAFLEDLTRRDRFFKNIRSLDAKNGLDDLSYVLVALNETNFFDSTKAMFKCVENPTDELCINRKNIPTKSSLKNIIHLVDFDPATIGELSLLLKKFNVAVTPHQEKIRTEVNKFRTSAAFVALRLQFVDAVFNKIKTGLTNEDRTFISNLLKTSDSRNENPWIYNWLQDEKLGREKFRDLLEYPVLTNPTFIADVKGIKAMYDKGFNCSFNNGSNDLFEFDLKTGIGDYLNVVKSKNYKTFYDFSSMHITGLKTSSEVCKEVVQNEYNANLLRAATKVAEFFGEKKFYELIKFVLSNSTSKADKDKTFAENIYLGDFLASDLFSKVNALSGEVFLKTRDLSPVMFDVIKSLPPETVFNLANVIDEITKIENDSKFIGVADFWSFFSDEEKNFVFNFLDRHFDKNINFTLLFDFYGKFLDDIQETQPLFKAAWTGSVKKDDQSYLALEDMFYNLSGQDTLKDFKKFFSRDHILKILEILSSGQKIAENAKLELKYKDSTTYITQSKIEKYKYVIKYDAVEDSDYDSKPIIECMQKFNELDNGLYELIRNLPKACVAITNENISFRLFGWLNSIETDFIKFKTTNNKSDSLFNQNGLMSPYMLNTNIGLLKIADNIVGPYQSTMPTQKGIQYLAESTNFYLNSKNGIEELTSLTNLISNYSDVLADKNQIYRNSLVKSFTKEDNFKYSRNVIINISDLMGDFGTWIKNGSYDNAVKRSLGTYNPNFSCEKMINQFISTNACPSKEAIKLWGNDLLFMLQNTWEKEMGSPIKYLLAGSKMGGYLEIPLNGKNTTKFKLTLKDNLKYLFDTFDRSLDVNNQPMKFVNEKGKESVVNVTTLERVETVIREVRFENNYLGATYLNHIVLGDDYIKDVKERKRLMTSCIKIPGVRCGRKMSDSDLRMAKNALEAFDSLLDVENGRGKEDKLHYGNFLKAFQQTLIASSSKEAQKVTFFPASDEVLKHHNGKVLGNLTMINGYSNTARFVMDRIGRSRKEFDNFLKREDFQRVDRVLLNGFDLEVATPAAERIVNKLRTIPSGEKQNMFENTVDWISSLTYDESLLLEDTVGRLMVVGSYLGTPQVVFEKNVDPNDFSRYQNNNLFQMFLALEKIIDYWPTLKNFFPQNAKLIDAIKPINTFLYFLTSKLEETNDPYKNKTYIALNDMFYVLQSVMFDEVADGRVIGKTNSVYRGIDFVVAGFKNSNLVSSTYSTIRSLYKFSDTFFENNGQFFLALGQNINRLAKNTRVDMTPIRDYLNFTSKNAICTLGDSSCVSNYHYDEPTTLVKYLNNQDVNGKKNIQIVNQKLFKENLKNITEFVNDILPAIRIKNIKPPLIN
jgi:hypothetical protein